MDNEPRRVIPEVWTPDMELIGVRIPDKMLVASLMDEARGNRTMAQFADECGTSPATFSRFKNGKMTKPMTVEMIKNIADHAEKKDPRMFERLARANGMMPKAQYEARQEAGNAERFSRAEERRQQETKVQNIIMTELINRGIPVTLMNRKDAELHSTCGQSLPSDFAIKTDLGQGEIIWSFMIVPYTLPEVLGEGHVPVGLYLRRTMQNMSGWFITDAWEPELLEGRLHSFLFIDGSVYLSFEDTVVIGAKVNSDLSFLTVDLEKEKVNFEIYLTRRDEAKHELIFSRQTIGNDDEEQDLWMMPGDMDTYYEDPDNAGAKGE